MLVPRRLDDQQYEDIVREAVGRLPWLCPRWTDHNSHDPGITLIELMAWYKEMLQYQMDQRTPALTRGLLQLAGVTPMPPEPAVCALEFGNGACPKPVLSRLASPQGVCFELLEYAYKHTLLLSDAVIKHEGRSTNVDKLLTGQLELQPFRFGGRNGSELLLGFKGALDKKLKLWFDVAPPPGAERSEFEEGQPPPRDIEWEFGNAGATSPALDGTHMLSHSGYVQFDVPGNWAPGPDGIYWLKLSLTRAGCEEQPRVRCVSDQRYQAAQQHTRARSCWFTLEAANSQSVTLDDAFAYTAELAVFLRSPEGWGQLAQYGDQLNESTRTLTLDAGRAAKDGKANLLVVCLEPGRVHELLLDTAGRPGEELYLNVEGQTVLPSNFRLLCQTLERDGSVRPAVWRRVDCLYNCGPRDRVFTYDPVRETINFGNGHYGAVPVPGTGSVLVMDLVTSLCGGGNVPANAGLRFVYGGESVGNAAAIHGHNRETLSEAGERLLRELETTQKCLSAADYERQAKLTPGLRVAAAKALPDYDPDAPVGARAKSMVTVVVFPDSGAKRPLPDERFLAAVGRQLARKRMIGVRTKAIGPRYVEIDVSVRMRVEAGLDKSEVVKTLDGWLSAKHAAFGVPVRRSDILTLLQHLGGVISVQRLELRSSEPGVYQTRAGDLRIPKEALAVLRNAEVELLNI